MKLFSINSVDKTLEKIFNSDRLSVLLVMFLVFYGGLAGPYLPTFILRLFDNPVFRIFILSLIVYKGNNDPKLSLMISIIFIITMDILNKKKLFERFTLIKDKNTEYLFESFGNHFDADDILTGLVDDEGKFNQNLKIIQELSNCKGKRNRDTTFLNLTADLFNKNKIIENKIGIPKLIKFLENNTNIVEDEHDSEIRNEVIDLYEKAKIISVLKKSFIMYGLGKNTENSFYPDDFDSYVERLNRILENGYTLNEEGKPIDDDYHIIRGYNQSKNYFFNTNNISYNAGPNKCVENFADHEDDLEEEETEPIPFNDSLKEVLIDDLVEKCNLSNILPCGDACKVALMVSSAVAEGEKSIKNDDLSILPDNTDFECITEAINNLAIFGVPESEMQDIEMPDPVEDESALDLINDSLLPDVN